MILTTERKYLLRVDTQDMPGKAKLTFVHFTNEIVNIGDEQTFLKRKFPVLSADAPELALMKRLVNLTEGGLDG